MLLLLSREKKSIFFIHLTILEFQVLCGSEEGTLTIWDLRQPAFPASYYTVHEKSSVSDIAFHHTDPTKLFTAAESGELFQWSHKAQPITERIDGQLTVVDNENVNPWLCGQRTKSRINVRVCVGSIESLRKILISLSIFFLCHVNF